MLIKIAFPSLVFVLLASATAAEACNPAPRLHASLARAIEENVVGKATGVILVSQRGCVLIEKAVGDPANGIPVPSLQAAFDAASIGKTFTAIAIQSLASRGKLKLTDPIRAYLPEMAQSYGDITIQNALDNNSGLGPYLLDGDDLTPRNEAGLLKSVGTDARKAGSGNGYAYSNVGFQLLGLVVARAAGEPFEAAMQDIVFKPAHLTSTGFFSSSLWKKKQVVSGYVKGVAVGTPATWPNTWSLLGAAGIATSAGDLFLLNRTFLAGQGLGADGRRRMLDPGVTTGGKGPMRVDRKDTISYGSGLYHWQDAEGRHIHFHGGDSDFGFHSMMLWREEDDVLLIGMFNSGSPSEAFHREGLAAAVTNALATAN